MKTEWLPITQSLEDRERAAQFETTWRHLALQHALDGRYLDAVIYGRVESSLDLLLWIIYCALRAKAEAAR